MGVGCQGFRKHNRELVVPLVLWWKGDCAKGLTATERTAVLNVHPHSIIKRSMCTVVTISSCVVCHAHLLIHMQTHTLSPTGFHQKQEWLSSFPTSSQLAKEQRMQNVNISSVCVCIKWEMGNIYYLVFFAETAFFQQQALQPFLFPFTSVWNPVNGSQGQKGRQTDSEKQRCRKMAI